jgi:hypothetical protein
MPTHSLHEPDGSRIAYARGLFGAKRDARITFRAAAGVVKQPEEATGSLGDCTRGHGDGRRGECVEREPLGRCAAGDALTERE